MEQHPIPQNISSYEFRLVGDMTLKQFLQLAGGILAGVIIYRLPLPVIIRYPLVFTAVVIGITLAFVPINGRPFARYIWAFLMAIYSPTEFIWKPTTLAATVAPQNNPPHTPTPQTPTEPSPLPLSNSSTLDDHPVVDSAPFQADETNNIVAAPTMTSTSTITAPPQPPEPTPEPSAPLPEPTSQTIFSAPPPEPISEPETPKLEAPTQTPASPPQFAVNHEPVTTGVPAQFTHLVIKPEKPNILTGLVATPEGNPIENAIVEIIDASNGVPARALRTNRLGQFQIATPLTPGSYILQTEKEGLSFEPNRIEAKDTIIEPVIITPIT